MTRHARGLREADLRGGGGGCVCLEELALPETEHAREDDRREGLDAVVVLHDRVVVALAHVADLVLGLGQLRLQVEEVGGRLEVGIGLAHSEERLEGAGEHVLGLSARFGRRGDHGGGACLRNRLERTALVRCVALDGLDEVGDEVEPALQLHVDLRPRIVDAIAHAHEVVVHADEGNGENNDDYYDDDEGDGKSAHGSSFRWKRFMHCTVYDQRGAPASIHPPFPEDAAGISGEARSGGLRERASETTGSRGATVGAERLPSIPAASQKLPLHVEGAAFLDTPPASFTLSRK